ncbi:uncharacterized protein LOC105261707 [Musca domestica]|uniref:Uncharacterized protein LOC105261707 n=1 Tax=Musca domestica TaxID=7370 RepID=A0A1I8NK99_MUSDO|nr:uncharacterized protein LOC105261707 [Musca domestica]
MHLSFEVLSLWAVIFFSSIIFVCSLVDVEQTWTYELKSIETYSSDPEKVKFGECKLERISRGVFAVMGSADIQYDIHEGDSNTVEFNSYRSANGKDYHPLPFKTPRQHIFEYLNTFYKDYVMDTLKDCSNFPAFEDKFEPPFERGVYYLDKCQFDQKSFPQHLQEGFYKVNMSFRGDVEWYIVFVAEVQSKV